MGLPLPLFTILFTLIHYTAGAIVWASSYNKLQVHDKELYYSRYTTRIPEMVVYVYCLHYLNWALLPPTPWYSVASEDSILAR